MKSDAVLQQYQALAMYGQNRTMRAVRMGLLLSAFAAFTFGLYFGAVPAYIIAAFFGVVALGTWEHTKMLELAARAAEASLPPQSGTILIAVRRPLDTDVYSAEVHSSLAGIWHFDFAAPNWKPAEGTFDATVYFVEGVSWPCLVVTEHGLVIPKQYPLPGKAA
jgi:hypothetical protein